MRLGFMYLLVFNIIIGKNNNSFITDSKIKITFQLLIQLFYK